MTYSQSTWRNAAAPIIARVIREVGTDDPVALRRALREAYPWGEKRMHPYKVWLDEIRRQLAGPSLVGNRRAPPVSVGQLAIPTNDEGEAETSPRSPHPTQ